MVDPKMLELTVYEDIPHLLVPVVTDPKRQPRRSFWAMDEMDRRYRLMRDKGARNIDNYNRTLEREAGSKRSVIDLMEPEATEETPVVGGNLSPVAPLVHEKLPRIVIIIDELADLMMTVGRDIEEYITRLAQKARRGHSFDSRDSAPLRGRNYRVDQSKFSGANFISSDFPCRFANDFGLYGGEKLLGNGDLLFLPPGTARIIRVHGAFVSDQEVLRVMKFIKQQGRPTYRPEVLEAKREIEAAAAADEEYDEMYDQALAIVTETQQASISMIQRRLRVGYNRAARMIEQMERDGVVGPPTAPNRVKFMHEKSTLKTPGWIACFFILTLMAFALVQWSGAAENNNADAIVDKLQKITTRRWILSRTSVRKLKSKLSTAVSKHRASYPSSVPARCSGVTTNRKDSSCSPTASICIFISRSKIK